MNKIYLKMENNIKRDNLSKNKERAQKLIDKYSNPSIININENRLISARELYIKLGFAYNYFKRWSDTHIVNSRLKIGIDYIIYEYMPIKGDNSNHTHANNRKYIDYGLTIDVAKKLCMKADTEMGDKIRDYFISVEKRYTAHLSYTVNENLQAPSEQFLLSE